MYLNVVTIYIFLRGQTRTLLSHLVTSTLSIMCLYILLALFQLSVLNKNTGK